MPQKYLQVQKKNKMNESSEASAGTVRISLCQAASVPGDVASNLLSVERHLREFAHVSDLVVFPEVHADTLGAEMYSHKPQVCPCVFAAVAGSCF